MLLQNNNMEYIQSIIDNVRARYWNMAQEMNEGDERGPGELNSSPLWKLYFNPWAHTCSCCRIIELDFPAEKVLVKRRPADLSLANRLHKLARPARRSWSPNMHLHSRLHLRRERRGLQYRHRRNTAVL